MSEFADNTETKMGSDRSFGLVFAVIFLIVALWPLTGEDGAVRLWSLGVAGALAVIAFLKADLLRPLNKLWFRFGLFLNRFMSPIVMGILFFVTVTPIGLIRRAFIKDPLRQRIDREARSYWVEVDREAAKTSSMKRQF